MGLQPRAIPPAFNAQRSLGICGRTQTQLCRDESAEVTDRTERREFVVRNRNLERVLGQDHDLHQRQRIEPEVLHKPKVLVAAGELRTQFALDVSLDDAADQCRYVTRIPRTGELHGRIDGFRRASLQGLLEVRRVLSRDGGGFRREGR